MKVIASIALGLLVMAGDAKEQFIADMKQYQQALTTEPVYQIACSFFYQEVDGPVIQNMTYSVWKEDELMVVELPTETRIYRTDQEYLVRIMPNEKEIIASALDSTQIMAQFNGLAQFDETAIRNELGAVKLTNEAAGKRTYQFMLADQSPDYRVTVQLGPELDMEYTIVQKQHGVTYESTSTLDLQLNQKNNAASEYNQLFKAATTNTVLPPNYSLYNLIHGQQ